MNSIVFYIYPDINSNDAFYLDVSEETIINITYSVQDLSDITKRKGSYSKTISFKGTANNNKAFKQAFNVQAFIGGWTPNKQIRCVIHNDGVQIFTGTLQLMSISVLNNSPIYECAIYSEEISLWKKMDDVLLYETTSISDWDHTWERAMFTGVFQNTYIDGYVYALIDNVGMWHCKELDSTGNGGPFSGIFAWLQAVMDRIIPLELFKPAVYVKALLEKIFAQHGYTWTSTFFNSAIFERLIIPYAGDGLIFIDETDKTFVGTNDYVEFDGESPFDTWVATFDLTGNAGTYPYEMAGCGQYVSNTYTACSNYSGNYYIEIYFPSLGGLFNNWQLTISVNDIDALTNIYDVDGVECTWTYGGNAASIDVRVSAIVNLKADQRIQIIVQRPTGSTGGEFIDSSVSDAYVLIDLIKKLSFEGSTIEIARGIPQTIKQIDLLSDLQKMFNLYFYASPTDPKNIIIEPFNDFYATGTTIDWSLKIDNSREMNIICGDPENRKRFIFGYANTTEAQSTQYYADESEQYGTRYFNTENYYGKGDEEIVTKCGTLIPSQYRTNIVASRVWGLQGNGTIQEGKIGYRIAQYNYIDFVVGGNYEWWLYPDADNTIDLNSANIQTQFPYCGHIDNPFSPTEDILFGMPKRLYWKLFNPDQAIYIPYSNNNLFNKYWWRYVSEITSAEAMVITAYFNINIADINALDFRNLIYFNGIKWRLLEISDYLLGKNVIVKCTLRRVLNLTDFVPTEVNPYGNTSTSLEANGEFTPVFSHPVIGL